MSGLLTVNPWSGHHLTPEQWADLRARVPDGTKLVLNGSSATGPFDATLLDSKTYRRLERARHRRDPYAAALLVIELAARVTVTVDGAGWVRSIES